MKRQRQGQHIQISKTFADLCKTQSAILFPLNSEVKGPKGSCGRLLILSGIMLLKRLKYTSGINKGKRIFSDEYLKQFMPKGINLKVYSSYFV
jgi:hypothetical protein